MEKMQLKRQSYLPKFPESLGCTDIPFVDLVHTNDEYICTLDLT